MAQVRILSQLRCLKLLGYVAPELDSDMFCAIGLTNSNGRVSDACEVSTYLQKIKM